MNNLWLDGWNEFLRLSARSYFRYQRWRQSRRLYRLEADLGELCWQQVDFDPSVEQQIQSLNLAEGQQGRLTNEIAEITGQTAAFKEKAATEIATIERELATLQTGQQSARQKLGQTRVRLPACEATIEGLRKNIGRTEILAQGLRQKLAALHHSQAQPAEIVAQRIALEDQQHLLDNTMLDLQRELAGLNQEFSTLKKDAETLDALISEQDKTLAALRGKKRAQQRSHQKSLDDQMSQQRHLHKKRQSFDTMKRVWFQQLGRQLADYDIAPLNQPQALHLVRQSRGIMENLDNLINGSLHGDITAAARRVGLLYLLLAVVLSLAILFLLMAILLALLYRLLGLGP